MMPRTCSRGRTNGHSCHDRLLAVQAAVRLHLASDDLGLREARAREVVQGHEGGQAATTQTAGLLAQVAG